MVGQSGRPRRHLPRHRWRRSGRRCGYHPQHHAPHRQQSAGAGGERRADCAGGRRGRRTRHRADRRNRIDLLRPQRAGTRGTRGRLGLHPRPTRAAAGGWGSGRSRRWCGRRTAAGRPLRSRHGYLRISASRTLRCWSIEVYYHDPRRRLIAGLGPAVQACRGRGRRGRPRNRGGCGGELALAARSVAEKLEMRGVQFPLVLSGGAFRGSAVAADGPHEPRRRRRAARAAAAPRRRAGDGCRAIGRGRSPWRGADPHVHVSAGNRSQSTRACTDSEGRGRRPFRREPGGRANCRAAGRGARPADRADPDWPLRRAP